MDIVIRTNRIGKPGLDITAKQKHVLSPEWFWVLNFLDGKITWEEYVERYMTTIRGTWMTRRPEWEAFIATVIAQGGVTLLCFCKSPERCHRRLAAESLAKVLEKRGHKVTLEIS